MAASGFFLVKIKQHKIPLTDGVFSHELVRSCSVLSVLAWWLYASQQLPTQLGGAFAGCSKNQALHPIFEHADATFNSTIWCLLHRSPYLPCMEWIDN